MTNLTTRFAQAVREVLEKNDWKEAISLIERQEELIGKQGKLNEDMLILIRELERQRDTVLVLVHKTVRQRNEAITKLAEATGRRTFILRNNALKKDENIQ